MTCGYLAFDRVEEDPIVLVVLLAPVLVADLDVLDRERFGVAVLRREGTPPRSRRAHGVFQRVERVLDQG